MMEQDLTMEVAAQLKAARKEQGLTMEQLGNMAGMTKGSISRLEKGEWSPSIRCLTPVVQALGYELKLEKGGDRAE